MIILGIDPSIRKTGIAIIKYKNQDTRIIHTKTITTNPELSLGKRLLHIEDELFNTIAHSHTEAVAIERPFLYKIYPGILALSAAYGTCLKVCAYKNLLTKEIPPAEVKKSIHGNGQADKLMVRKALIKKFHNKYELSYKSEDEIDAIAIALTLQNILEQQNNMLV